MLYYQMSQKARSVLTADISVKIRNKVKVNIKKETLKPLQAFLGRHYYVSTINGLTSITRAGLFEMCDLIGSF